jgi:hypothetical protein
MMTYGDGTKEALLKKSCHCQNLSPFRFRTKRPSKRCCDRRRRRRSLVHPHALLTDSPPEEAEADEAQIATAITGMPVTRGGETKIFERMRTWGTTVPPSTVGR